MSETQRLLRVGRRFISSATASLNGLTTEDEDLLSSSSMALWDSSLGLVSLRDAALEKLVWRVLPE